jgi:SAM-dependent methyltransferase
MLQIDQTGILRYHQFLLGETRERLERYERALTQAISPGDVVLDLGSGTGVLALLACRAGARRVYAIEQTEAIDLARALSAGTSVGSRISFVHSASVFAELPEKADVLVTDIFGTFGLQAGGLSSVADAHSRLLKEGAVSIPCAVELHVAPVEAADFYETTIDFWTRTVSGLDLLALRAPAVNNCYSIRLEPRALLGDPARVTRVSLAHADVSSPTLAGQVTIPVTKRGTLHGLGGWFTADLGGGVSIDNSPGSAMTNYAQTFFPLSAPVLVEEGDKVTAAVQSYDAIELRWQVEVHASAAAAQHASSKARFDHSTFLGFPVSKEWFQRLSPVHKGTGNER